MALQPARYPALQPARCPALLPAHPATRELPCPAARTPCSPRAALPCSPRTALPSSLHALHPVRPAARMPCILCGSHCSRHCPAARVPALPTPCAPCCPYALLLARPAARLCALCCPRTLLSSTASPTVATAVAATAPATTATTTTTTATAIADATDALAPLLLTATATDCHCLSWPRSRATGTAGARAGGTGGAGAGGAGGTGATSTASAGAGGTGGAGAGGTGGAGAGGTGGAGAGGVGAVGGTRTAPRRPFFYPQSSLPPLDSALRQDLSIPSSAGLTPPLLCPPPDQSRPPLLPGSPLPAPSPYPAQTSTLAERREPEPRPASPVHTVVMLVVLVFHLSLARTLWYFSDLAHAASPTVTRLLATVFTDPSFESTAASALVNELVNFAATRRLDYVANLFELKCLAAVLPRFASVLLCPEEVPDALDISTPCSYQEAITGEYSSQWQTAMDVEMASWKSTGTYVDEVPPRGANIVDGMWIFRVKWPLGSPPAFKARYVARGFSLGSLHEEIWLRHPPSFTGSFPEGTQWSLRRPVYGLRQAPREWHNTLRTTLAALGFAPSTVDPSLFLLTDPSLNPFYILVYIDDLVFATADIETLTLVKAELQKSHTCTDLGELRNYLGLHITWNRARRTIAMTQSHMVHEVV
ncbi:unnamed protein product [Closterium sp. NIES-53]